MRKFLLSALSVVATLLVMNSCSYDDSSIWNEVNNVKERVEELEKSVQKINNEIATLQTILDAMQDNVYVTDVNQTSEDYTIIFSNGTTATITNGRDGSNGKDGKDGKDGATPVISVKQGKDNNFYWTINGEWLLVDGQRVRANGNDGIDGTDGIDGKEAIAPQVRINDQTKEWEISTDGGNTWVSTGVVAEGKDGENIYTSENESLFKSVDTTNSDYVIITLADDTELKLARYDDSCPRFIIVDAPAVAEVEYGKSVEFMVECYNIEDYTINKPEGWKAKYDENILVVTAPAKDLCHYDIEGVVATTVVSPEGKSAIVKLKVCAIEVIEEPETPEEPEEPLGYTLKVLTFEDEDALFQPYYLEYAYGWSGKEIFTWSDLIDDSQYNGPLMYGNDQMDAMYYWYDEGNTELYHMFPDNYAYCYWGGGHAVSNYWGAGYADEDRNNHIAKYYGQEYVNQWAGKPGADAALGWFLLQLTTPVAAHSGDNFCVHYGYKDDYSYIENIPELSFMDGEPRVIDHMYVTNTIYTLNQLYNGVKSEEGNSFGGNWSGLTEDAWLKIAAYGYASIDDDEPCSEAEFYLVKGYEVVEEWQKWDLSELGAVAKVQFNFLYSDQMGGRYGFTIPGYFAYDDIAVRFED